MHRELSIVLCDDLEGLDEAGRQDQQEDQYVYIHIGDSICCTAKTITPIVKQLYANI